MKRCKTYIHVLSWCFIRKKFNLCWDVLIKALVKIWWICSLVNRRKTLSTFNRSHNFKNGHFLPFCAALIYHIDKSLFQSFFVNCHPFFSWFRSMQFLHWSHSDWPWGFPALFLFAVCFLKFIFELFSVLGHIFVV